MNDILLEIAKYKNRMLDPLDRQSYFSYEDKQNDEADALEDRLRSTTPTWIYERLECELRSFPAEASYAFLDTNHADKQISAFWSDKKFYSLLQNLGIFHLGYEWPPSWEPLKQAIIHDEIDRYVVCSYVAEHMPVLDLFFGMSFWDGIKNSAATGVDLKFVDATADKFSCGVLESILSDFEHRMDDTDSVSALRSNFGNSRFGLIYGSGHADGAKIGEDMNSRKDFPALLGRENLVLIGISGSHCEGGYLADGRMDKDRINKFDLVVDLQKKEILRTTRTGMKVMASACTHR